ncbi:MAG: hypothetical protein EZS28_029395 [Streblomastix strix]|uniref:Adhesin domain-containing protein n=1 Tax=Streblomastix strix TaxID=222440 RepID=A0A5J4UXL3_9EUKA|nr:MAG: hypothetical protein EZS28_029395 [Streblomastix strix]
MKIAFLILLTVLLASQIPNTVQNPTYPTEYSEWGTCWKADPANNDAYVSGKAGDDDDSDGSNNYNTYECGKGFDNSCRTIKYTLCKFAQNITSGQTFTVHLEESPFFIEQKLEFKRVGRKFIIDGELGRSFIKHNDSLEIQFIYVNGSEVSFTSCYIQQEEVNANDQSGAIIQMDSGALNLYRVDINYKADSLISNVEDYQVIQAVSGTLNLFDVRLFHVNSVSKALIDIKSDVIKADITHLRFQGVELRGEQSSCLSVDVSKELQFNISFSNFYDVQINGSITRPVLAAPIYIYFGTPTHNYEQNKEEIEEEKRINMIQSDKVRNANGFAAIQDIVISNCNGSQTGGILFDV